MKDLNLLPKNLSKKKQTKPSNRKAGKVFKIGIALIILGSISATGVFLYQQRRYPFVKPIEDEKTLATKKSEGEAQQILNAVSKLIELPAEEPKIATVADKSRLDNNAFFQKAENGDKILIFTEAKKAILYRPSIRKIIDVTPIFTNPNSSQVAGVANSTPEPITQEISLVLYNGSQEEGATLDVETTLNNTNENLLIIDRNYAKRRDYEKTLVIDLNGTLEEEAKQIAGILDADVSSLPTGEVKPEGDILIIVGNDIKTSEEPTPTPTTAATSTPEPTTTPTPEPTN